MQFWKDQQNIDLREELAALIHGRLDIVQQGQTVIIRKLTDQFCVCWDGVSGGPNRMCRYCQGEGYYWSEVQVIIFMVRGAAPVYKPGYLANGQYPQAGYGYDDPDRSTAFAEYFSFPDYERYTLPSKKNFDKLYELKVDNNGAVVYPQVRASKWKMLSVVPMRGDFGRIEYFTLALEKENVA